jgi:hypothetical protein
LSVSLSPEEKIVILAGFDRIRSQYVGDGYADAVAETAVYVLAGICGHPRIPKSLIVQLASNWLLTDP